MISTCRKDTHLYMLSFSDPLYTLNVNPAESRLNPILHSVCQATSPSSLPMNSLLFPALSSKGLNDPWVRKSPPCCWESHFSYVDIVYKHTHSLTKQQQQNYHSRHLGWRRMESPNALSAHARTSHLPSEEKVNHGGAAMCGVRR